ncbi:hypothetical protein NOJ05_14130 [Neorhizobium galegae]|uniref:hypothetical protein n=1 Tax=Neorhizobium galegae TaxID=399 RepID=UPI0006221E7A|nr:hypothetical protein [Neorhizobium galegae]MCQ1778341.1 hypothetical protein [Neorhizobium galegae]MCQ1796684.1 hypothetical protein [Neorhizobium galegae]CDZ29193.1 Hypothetical protein NGAL_HAMBI490_40550 [Neorhizobium galegae bv. officinalis]
MLPFLEKALKAKSKSTKGGLSVVNVKKLVATVQNMGKSVIGITAAPDGSITVSIGEPSPADDILTNPWDEVLK